MRRIVAQIGEARVTALVEGALAGPIEVAFLDVPGKRAKALQVQSDWWPGEPLWTGTVAGRPVAVQVRPILNGYDLSSRGIRGWGNPGLPAPGPWWSNCADPQIS